MALLIAQVKNFDANSIFIIGLMVMIFIFMVNALFFFRVARPWSKAWFFGAPISFAEMLSMRLRRSNVEKIVDCYIMSVQANARIPIKELDVAFHSGADLELVTRAYIEAKKSGNEISLEDIVDASRSEKLEQLLKRNQVLN